MKSSKGKGPANGGTKVTKKPFPLVNRQISQHTSVPKDPVQVYCRVRPLKEDELESCVSVPEDTILQITPPECSLAFKNGHKNANQHKFKYVFSEISNQRKVFDSLGLPLVEDLLQGKNALLFAYGITNSGKTYTMNGEADQAGILPRSLDIIFNSIADVQAPKCVFRPDGTNGFDIFTEEDAIAEAQRNKPKKISSKMRSEMPEYGDLLRIAEPRKVDKAIDEDSNYSVFVSYVEIYNNFVYDLLENKPLDNIKPFAPVSHNLREDTSRNMYVSGATEVEVKSTEEAFEVLYRGQKVRRVANTQLNQGSSRSHSVFTIKLVQAPLDHTGREVLQDKSKVVFSQLSLVDLAGSERTSRTGSSGERLKEAGNINKDLMVLRTCMEILRENQTSNATKYVPYRDSKLTHLFKNYFDGEGKVRMVVCISPRSEDYDESIQVMRFAEVTQEVVVARPETVKVNTGLAPGRKRAYMLYKAAMSEASKVTDHDEQEPAAPIIHPYTLALGVISIQKYMSEYCSVEDFSEFKEHLEKRSLIRQQLVEDLHKKQVSFKEDLMELENEADVLRASTKEHKGVVRSRDKLARENQELRTLVASQDEQVAQLTARLEQVNSHQTALVKQNKQLKEQLALSNKQTELLAKTTELYEADKRELENELVVGRQQLEKNKKHAYQLRQTMDGRVKQQKEKFDRLAQEMKVKQDKLKQVEEVIKNSPLVTCTRGTLKESNHPNIRTPSTASLGTPSTLKKGNNAPALRTRASRKRSLSENWLEHKPQTTVKSGDILQPSMKKKKTVSTPRPRDFRSKQVDKYCLQHQEEDSQGEVKTALFKGAIQRTRGGGTSVKFTDVEVLKHSRPKTPSTVTKAPRRSTRIAKINTSKSDDSLSSMTGSECSPENTVNDWTDVETRCAVAIEGRPGNSSPAYAHTLADRPAGQL